MARITDMLTAPQVARAHMRAGSGFEAEASVAVSPLGLLAIGGLVGIIVLSAGSAVRASRRPPGPASSEKPELDRREIGAPSALSAPSADFSATRLT